MSEWLEAGSAQMSIWVDKCSVYVAEWSRLVRMNFEASQGELSPDDNANSGQNHCMLSAVRVAPASKVSEVCCHWEGQHVDKFLVGVSLWISCYAKLNPRPTA